MSIDPPTASSPIRWVLPLGILGLVAALYLGMFYRDSPDVYVTVVNHGPDLLHNVAIHVVGRAHLLGDMPPGASQTRLVLPSGPSALTIEYTDAQARPIRLDPVGQLTPESRGTARIELTGGKVTDFRSEIQDPAGSIPVPAPQ